MKVLGLACCQNSSHDKYIIYRDEDELQVTVKPYGYDLFTKFAKWFGAQPHPHKVLIAGNHDWVMQAMGAAEVQKVLDKFSTPGK